MKQASAKRGIDPSAHGARSHVRTGIVLSVIQVFGLLLAVGQDAIAAKLFGARVEMDTYLEAWIVPVVLSNIVGPALQNALVPHFALARAQRGDDAAWELAAEALLAGLGVFVLLGVIGIVAAHWILDFIAAGAPSETRPLLSQIYVIGFIYGGLSLAAALLGGLCNAAGRFVAPAVMASLSTLVPVVGLLLLGRALGIKALPWSLAVGALCQTGALIWTTRSLGLRRPTLPPGLLLRLGPLLRDGLTVAIATIPLGAIAVAERHFGSRLAEGSVAQLNYANKVLSAALRVFAGGLGVMGLPLLSAYLARGERARFERVFSLLFRLGCYASVVGAVGLTLAGTPLIKLLFQRGRFTTTDTFLVGECLRRSAWYLVYGVVFPVLSAALLSGRRTWILPVANTVGLFAYLTVAVLNTRPGGQPLGLALAYSIGCCAILVPAYFLLWRDRLITSKPLTAALWRCLVLAPLLFAPLWLCQTELKALDVPPVPTLIILGLLGALIGSLGIALLDAEVKERVVEALRRPLDPPAVVDI